MRTTVYFALAVGLLFLAGLLASMSLGLGATATVETITTLGQTLTVASVEPGSSVTITRGGTTRTITIPGPVIPGPTRTVVKIVAGPVVTVPQTVPGPSRTVTTPGTTQTVTSTVSGPTQTVTHTVAGPTQTVVQNVAGPTVTQTITVTVGGPNCPPPSNNPNC